MKLTEVFTCPKVLNRICGILLGLLLSTTALMADTPVNRQVRSLLSNRCFACHGPDEAQRKGGFHFLDNRSAFQAADSGEIPIVAGNPEKSEIIKRIRTKDEGLRMPPPEFGAAMTEQEAGLIEQWIRDGANLEQHWSFIPPVRAGLPSVDIAKIHPELDPAWNHHPIDRFVLQTLSSRGMKPSPKATRAELIRRLSLDLTGLPPSLDDVEAFVKNESPNAYAQLVDRFLASPRFGEHWARKWLDLARYADSAGYADDPPRTIWAYRDWVIQSLNDNLTVDQFTIEQLAGDLLPSPTESQLVATAFHRNTLTNNEGGTNDEEFRNVAIVDRVNTTMAVWMGITFNCAQCHTHKYDPFSQAEYFKVFAILNQTEDADRRDESPTIDLYSMQQQRDRQQWLQRQGQLEKQFQSAVNDSLAKEMDAWEQTLRAPQWIDTMPIRGESNSKSDFAIDAEGKVLVKPIGANIVTDNYTLELDLPPSTIGKQIHGIALRTLPRAELPGGGAGLAGGNFVLTDITVSLLPERTDGTVPKARFVRIELPGNGKILSLAEVEVFSDGKNVAREGTATQSTTDFGGLAQYAIDGITDGDFTKHPTTHTASSANPWLEIDLGKEVSIDAVVLWNRTDNGLQNRLDGCEVKLLDLDRKTISKESIAEAPKLQRKLEFRETVAVPLADAFADFSQVGFPAKAVVDADRATGWAVGGGIAEPHQLTVIPKQPVSIDRPTKLRLELAHGSSHRHHLLGSFAISLACDQGTRDWVSMSEPLRKIHLTSKSERTAAAQSELTNFFARNIAESLRPAREELAELDRKLAGLKPETNVPVLKELPPTAGRKTHVQLRGNYKSLGDEVTPGVPVVFHPLSVEGTQIKERSAPNRLDLARWLVDRRNPLTARVWVNRLWESLFGIGIVRTSEEFGSQGDAPTHPQLLDWMACEFMETRWDVKAMLRSIVTSQTYMQSSQVTAEGLAADRDNIWLARGPRVRLSAEMVRDQALAISGLLSGKMFGPPVRPPQPNLGLKAAFGSDTDWKTSEGEDRYRRGVYTTWRRSNPYPSMATFDAPSGEVCTLRRDSTNTPLQALVTLNDPGFVEAAQGLARLVRLHRVDWIDDSQRIAGAFQLCTSRMPDGKEIASLEKLLNQSRQELAKDPSAAKQLATDPIGPLPAQADAVELGAWTTVCNVLLNLDEVLMKR